MSRSTRQHFIDRALMRVLVNCGSYLCPETALKEGVEIACGAPPLRMAEFQDALIYLEGELRIRVVPTETGPKWKLTDLGRDWALENRIS